MGLSEMRGEPAVNRPFQDCPRLDRGSALLPIHDSASDYRDLAAVAHRAADIPKATWERLADAVDPARAIEIATVLRQPLEGRLTDVGLAGNYALLLVDDGSVQPFSASSAGQHLVIPLAAEFTSADSVAA